MGSSDKEINVFICHSASVLYDKPTQQFHIPTIEEKHRILTMMNDKYHSKPFAGKYDDTWVVLIVSASLCFFFFSLKRSPHTTRFTQENEQGQCSYLPDRPAIIVSSTSWSEDEDFTLLFDALKRNELWWVVSIVFWTISSLFRIWFSRHD